MNEMNYINVENPIYDSDKLQNKNQNQENLGDVEGKVPFLLQDFFQINKDDTNDLQKNNKQKDDKIKYSNSAKVSFNIQNKINTISENSKEKENKDNFIMINKTNYFDTTNSFNKLPPPEIVKPDNLIEPISLFLNDEKKTDAQIIIHNYTIKFVFDYRSEHNFYKAIHFSPKYFEFPIFYTLKQSFDPEIGTTISLKDYRSFKIKSKNDNIVKILNKLTKFNDDFNKYAYFYKQKQDSSGKKYKINGWEIYDPICEYLRQGVDFSKNKFCFSYLNTNYSICDTYPGILVVPSEYNNENLKKAASYRMKNRLPILSYFYTNYKPKIEKSKKCPKEIIKSYLYRAAQIKTGGIIFKNKNEEIEYVNKITNMEKNNKGFIIFDCRPLMNAKANTFLGAGVENIKNYNNCKELIFGCIENIHAVRKSLKNALLKVYYGKESITKGKIYFNIDNCNMKNFLSKFEDTKWLEYLSDLIIGSINIVNNLIKGINVICHCSDGWDRTSQICCLVQIIIDPYYRTIEGFIVLIEKDFISIGHQFAIRNGCDVRKEKKKERSPIFVQFLHAVYQIILQFPTAFEFRSNLLLFLCEEVYSNKYGTFLFNSEKEKLKYCAKDYTVSIWSDVYENISKYINILYKKVDGVLNVKGEMQYLSIWNDYFFQYDKVGGVEEGSMFTDKNQNYENIKCENEKDIIELLKIINDKGLSYLAENIGLYKLYKDRLSKENEK